MAQMIKLTKDQADQVSGEYPNKYFLQPTKIGSYYYLPIGILENPAYVSVMSILLLCPVVEMEYPDEVPEL